MTSRDASTRRSTGSSGEPSNDQHSEANRPVGRERRSGRRQVKPGTFRQAGRLTVALWKDERFLELPDTSKLVCSYLAARRANGDGACWPRVKEIAETLGCSRSTVQRALRKAEEAGLLEIVEWRHDESGQQVSNTYYFDVSLISESGSAGEETDD
jgi:AraC-like DNA-binding protein